MNADELAGADARAIIMRLYAVILDRVADPVGLSNYAGWAKAGSDGCVAIAAHLLQSTEFASGAGAVPTAEVLCRRALARQPTEAEAAMPPAALAVDLITRDAVIARLRDLWAWYDGGASMQDAPLYRCWAAGLRAYRADRRTTPAVPGPGPLLTVILVDDGANPSALAATLGSLSILSQTGGGAGLELLIALGRGTAVDRSHLAALRPAVVRTLRARWTRSVAGRLNRALRTARGAFVCILSPGDQLDAEVLDELAAAAPDSDVVLSDEDTIGPEGLGRPILNGGWDIEAALSRPPRCPVIVRTTLLRAIGGFRIEADGVLEWDILLRAASHTGHPRVVHLPVALRHRPPERPGRDLGRPANGPRIVRDHLERTGQSGCRLEGDGVTGPIRVVHPLPASPPLATLIIPTRDRADLLAVCLKGVLQQTDYPNIEVLVVDNESRETNTLELFTRLKEDPRVHIMPAPGPFDWSAHNNAAVEAMRGEVAVLLNNDIEVIEPHWLHELVSQAIRPDVGAVGAKLLYPDRTVQHAGIALGPGCRAVHVWRHSDGLTPGYLDQLRIVRTVSAVTGACIALRRDVLREVGGIEQTYLKVTWSDIDLCMRVRTAGYKVIWTPHALLYHIELATRGSDDQPATRPRFLKETAHFQNTWAGLADRDPYHSPNLALVEGDATLSMRFLG